MPTDIIPIQPVSKDLLYMKVADAIHNYIHENKLKPGDKIPSERVLAAQLQTGRNSVREALRVLENERIIEVKTGRGAFVTDNTTPDSIYLKLFKGNYFELLEIKAILEREVIRTASRIATPRQFAELDEILQRVERKAAAGVYAEIEDQMFHRKILQICGNRSMEHMVSRLIEILSGYATLLDNADAIFITTVPYHRIMLEAMERQDHDRACAAYNKILEIDKTALEAVEKEKQEPKTQ